MNYSRILCAAILCSTIAAVHASQAPQQSSPATTKANTDAQFNQVIDAIANFDVNAANFENTFNALFGPAKDQKTVKNAVHQAKANQIESIQNKDAIIKNIDAIRSKFPQDASQISAASKQTLATLSNLKQKISHSLDKKQKQKVSSAQQAAVTVTDSLPKLEVLPTSQTTPTPADDVNSQSPQSTSSEPQTPNATQATPNTDTPTPDVTTPENPATGVTPEETDPSKITPPAEDPNAGKKTDVDQGGKKDDQKDTDPNKDAVKASGFFKTYVFNAKTGAAASVVGLGAAGYYYYTTYMLPEEILTEEAAPAA